MSVIRTGAEADTRRSRRVRSTLPPGAGNAAPIVDPGERECDQRQRQPAAERSRSTSGCRPAVTSRAICTTRTAAANGPYTSMLRMPGADRRALGAGHPERSAGHAEQGGVGAGRRSIGPGAGRPGPPPDRRRRPGRPPRRPRGSGADRRRVRRPRATGPAGAPSRARTADRSRRAPGSLDLRLLAGRAWPRPGGPRRGAGPPARCPTRRAPGSVSSRRWGDRMTAAGAPAGCDRHGARRGWSGTIERDPVGRLVGASSVGLGADERHDHRRCGRCAGRAAGARLSRGCQSTGAG